MQKATKVYGFGTAFYSELQESQKNQGRYFTYVLIFSAICMFFLLGLLPPTFAKDIFRISSLQLRILATTLFLCILILCKYLYEIFVVERNIIIDIEEGDDNWVPIQAKVVDFWFTQTLSLRGIRYASHIILQLPYKKRPLRIKVICPIVTMPKYISELAIHDPLMKNFTFLMGLVRKIPPEKLSDDQKKHMLHKRIPHILTIQKSVTVYMDKRNQYNPYTDISLTSLFATPYNAGSILLLDKITIVCRFLLNCMFIYWIFYIAISILLGLLLLLGGYNI